MRKNILILGHNAATQFIDIYNQYTRLFDPAQYSVTVAYLTGKPDPEVAKRTIAEQTLFLNFSKKSVRGIKLGAINALLKLCREKQFEIVICHRYKPIYTMLWVAQFCRIPALVSVMHELGTLQHKGRQWLIKALTRKNMLFAGVSNAVRDDMRQDLRSIPKERIITLYNVIDVDLIEPQLLSRSEARTRLNLAPDDFLFGHVARLAPNKDQATLIHAFALLKDSCPKAKLVILGTGELATELESLAKNLGVADRIIFSGFVELGYRYMKAFDCFVLSSIQEAFGRVLIEAMLAHLPIIATRVHGIPEVVGTAGKIIEPRDTQALATAMRDIYLASPQERHELGEAAYQQAINHYSIPPFQKQFWTAPILRDLVKEPNKEN